MSGFDTSSAHAQNGLSLREILPAARFHNTSDLTVRSCSGCWDECLPDDLYIALVEADSDGHNDVNRAIQRGASAILTERLLPIASPQCIVDDSRVAYGQIAHALVGHPGRRLRTVAVAGADGKSSTIQLANSIFATAGLRVSANSAPSRIGSIATRDCWTQPGLAKFLADQVIDGNEVALVEASEADLTGHRLAGACFSAVVITNMRVRGGQRHHPQMRLLDYLKPEGVAVVNADDPLTGSMINQIDVPTLTVGIREDAEVHGKILESFIDEQSFMITAGNESIIVRTRIPGAAHVYNCLQATAVGLAAGIDLVSIGNGLESVQSIPGRLNVLRCGQPYAVVIDQGGTAYRLGAALNMLRRHITGRIYCVFSPPENCTPDVAGQFGRVAERGCDIAVITRPEVAPQLNFETDHQVLDGFRRPAGAHLIPDRITAIEWALSQAGPGDAVLIAGRGERSICSLAEDRWQLTDDDVCQAWLYGDSSVNQTIVNPVVNPRIFRIDDYRPC